MNGGYISNRKRKTQDRNDKQGRIIRYYGKESCKYLKKQENFHRPVELYSEQLINILK